jgi:Arc/MetJ-type ribon-helix-helix transcriptional regulator
MPNTEAITLTLPAELVTGIRDLVRLEAFASENDVITEAVRKFFSGAGSAFEEDAELVQWMKSEGRRRLELMAADPAHCLTVEQVFEALESDETEAEHGQRSAA